MRRTGFLLVVLLALGLGSGCMPKGPKGQLTVHVEDDNSQSIPEAKVAFVGGGTREEGKTDRDGFFAATFHNVAGEVDIVVEKDGFYSISRRTYIFTGHTNDFFLPWNPIIELQLHKIGNPVPMVVKKVEEYLPVLGKPVGYDLLIGDWVAPYGKGTTNDFTFKADRQLVNDWTYSGTLSLPFSDPADGLA